MYSTAILCLNYFFLISTDFVLGTGSRVIDSESQSESGSGMHSKHLMFLDICSQFNMFRNVDDDTEVVELPSSLSFGRVTYNKIYVSFCHYIYGIILAFH